MRRSPRVREHGQTGPGSSHLPRLERAEDHAADRRLRSASGRRGRDSRSLGRVDRRRHAACGRRQPGDRALAERGHMQAQVTVSVDVVAGGGRPEKDAAGRHHPGERTEQRTVRVEPAGLALADDIQQSIGAVRLLELAECGSSTLVRGLTDALRDQGYVQGTARVDGPVFDGPPPPGLRRSIRAGIHRRRVDAGRRRSGPGGRAPRPGAGRFHRRDLHAGGARRRSLGDGPGLPAPWLRQGRSHATTRRPAGRPCERDLRRAQGRQQVLQRVVVEGNRAVRADEILACCWTSTSVNRWRAMHGWTLAPGSFRPGCSAASMYRPRR